MDKWRHAVDHFITGFNSMSPLVKIHMIMFDDARKILSFTMSLEVYHAFLETDKYGGMENFVHVTGEFYDQINVYAQHYLNGNVDWDKVNQIGTVHVDIE